MDITYMRNKISAPMTTVNVLHQCCETSTYHIIMSDYIFLIL